MKQIYDFERYSPPPLCESELRRTLYAHTRRRQTAQLICSSVLLMVCIFLLGLRLAAVAPLVAVFCCSYAAVGLVGGAVILRIFFKKKGAEKT